VILKKNLKINTKEKMSLEELITIVAKAMGVSDEEIVSTSRKRKIAHARSVVTYAAIRNLGYRGTDIAKVLSLSAPTVSQNIDKGKFFLDRNEELKINLSINYQTTSLIAQPSYCGYTLLLCLTETEGQLSLTRSSV